jgi:hypothetical protein
MKEISYNSSDRQFYLDGKKITLATAVKYWNQEGHRKAAWTDLAYKVMCEIRR